MDYWQGHLEARALTEASVGRRFGHDLGPALSALTFIWWLWWSGMASDQTLVAFLVGAFGFAFLSAAIRRAFDHSYRDPAAIIGVLVGLVLLVAGFFWSRLATELDARLVGAIGDVASNIWVWFIVLFSFWVYLAISSIVALIQRNQYGEIIKRDINPFRLALQRYVIPRHLSPEQIEAVGAYLRTFPPYPVTFKVHKNDPEAIHYSRFLQKALLAGGWTIVGLDQSLELSEGVTLMHFYADPTQRRRSDPRDPTPHQLLVDAFAKANVHLTGGGGAHQPGIAQDQMEVHVGPRSIDLQAPPQPWPLITGS